MKIRFHHLFTWPLYRQADVFKLFKFGLGKVIGYFLLLNLVMMLPITIGILRMETINYAQFGFDIEEDAPAWLPGGLPPCYVNDYTLDCPTDETDVFYFEFNETLYEIHFNVADAVTIEEENTLVFKQSEIIVNFTGGIQLNLDYRGFEGLDFAEISAMEQSEGARIMLDALFQSVHPHLVMPLMIITVGGMIAMNFILLAIFAGVSMLFKFLYSAVPSYKNTLKLFIIASTIPAIINLVLGLFGFSPFTSIVFNFVTPVVAFLIYRKNIARMTLEEEA